jgi:hypothetical protein
VTKKALQKKLNERAEKNAALFEKLEDQIDEAIARIDFAALERDHAPIIQQIGACALSCLNVRRSFSSFSSYCA